VRRFSALGKHGGLWYAIAGIGGALDPGRRGVYRRVLLTTAGAFAANQAIKFTVCRHRPRLEGLPPLTDTVSQLSYPSAHATTSFAAARVLSAALPAAPLYAVAAAMALSRLYLGVHFPSDTLAGAALGGSVGRLAA
jgi:membrane-associated phospholipid phosphatase